MHRAVLLPGSMVAADVLAVGSLYRGSKATYAAVKVWQTHKYFPYSIAARWVAENRAQGVSARIRTADEHAQGTLAVGVPIAIGAEHPSGFGEIAKTVGLAFFPFSGVKAQLKHTKAAC